MTAPDFAFETAARAEGFTCIAGVDEVGCGPLAGPVVAAAVILDPGAIPEGLNDSKRLTEPRRNALAEWLRENADGAVGIASVEEIDTLNILRASHLAMARAIAALRATPDLALIDGVRLPRDFPCPARTVVKGDARVLSIAAASILAKVTRDAIMADLARDWPHYAWERNAGYPTKAHLQALNTYGVTPHHRRSFRPIHNILCKP